MIARVSMSVIALSSMLAATPVWAPAARAQTPPAPAAAKAPDALVLFFATGSAAVRPADTAVLDQASRLYRDGRPIVMVVSGSADPSGSPEVNLRLSQLRANNVVQGLVARGIPAERFQILAKGATDAAAAPAGDSEAEAKARRVEITWR